MKDTVGFLIADLARLMRRKFASLVDPGGLTLAEARALVYVANNEGMRQVDLASLLEIRPITLGRLIDTLETKGIARREPDPQDGRAYRLYLMPKARAHIAKIEEIAKAVRLEAMQGIGEHDAAFLSRILSKMRANLAR